MPDELARYARQIRFAPLGEAGQRQLMRSCALVCGCGALGSFVANLLVRAGVGTVRLVDRDFVETSNLQRQVLFDEQDAAAGVPKAVAAAEKLARVNSQVRVEPVVADIDPRNIEQLAQGANVLVDGTDNFETRFLLNDFSVSQRVPWVYGGCLGTEGQVLAILPGEGPCLRCLIPDCPTPGSTPTCDMAGILGPTVGFIAALETMEALKILSGNREAVSRSLLVVDLWTNRFHQVNVGTLAEQANCPACCGEEFPWLAGRAANRAAVLCGRNAVQLSRPDGGNVDLERLTERLQGVGQLIRNPYLLRLTVEPFTITVFADGRVIVAGTDNPTTARTVCAKYLGN
jgi:molybdopterin/thiamine biosynthesis adenylyltransferase